MECRKWEEKGLLYVNGELDVRERTEFENHVNECVYCREETENYQEMKDRFFTEANLLDSPSKATDEKILKACMKTPRPAVAGIGLFAGSLKKTFFSLVFLVIGFSLGVYLTYNLNYDKNNLQADNTINRDVNGSGELANSDSLSDIFKDDSTVKDSAKAYTPSHRGDLNTDGAISVGVMQK